MRVFLTIAFCLSLAVLTICLALVVSDLKQPTISLALTAGTTNARDQGVASVKVDEIISSNDPRISAFEVSQYSSGAHIFLEAKITVVGACAEPGDTVDSWIEVTKLDGMPIVSEKAEFTLGAIHDDFVHQRSWTDCHFSSPPKEIKLKLNNREQVRGTLVATIRGRKLAFTLPDTEVINDLRSP